LSPREQHQIESTGDLEAIIVAETYDLLSSVFGPYIFTVSGNASQQTAVFPCSAAHTLFFIYMYEFVATESPLFVGEDGFKDRSLFGGGKWLVERYPGEAAIAGMDTAATELAAWLERRVRVRFWSGNIWRHVELNETFRTYLAPHSHFAKHSLLKLGREVIRLRDMATQAGTSLTTAQAVAAREEFVAHLAGMMEYHATRLAELVGRYFVAFHKFVKNRYSKYPTNNLDLIAPPEGISDDVYRYMYAHAVFSFSGWSQARIEEFVPETAGSLKLEYPQHEEPDPPA